MMSINKYRGFCERCWFTVYPGEGYIDFSGREKRVTHKDCKHSLNQKGIKRSMNPQKEKELGEVSYKKLGRMLESYEF